MDTFPSLHQTDFTQVEDRYESMKARQHIRRNASSGAVLAVVLLLMAIAAHAQQVTGELGSPNATTTIDGKQLPPHGSRERLSGRYLPESSQSYPRPILLGPSARP
jgi:arylsulfatase